MKINSLLQFILCVLFLALPGRAETRNDSLIGHTPHKKYYRILKSDSKIRFFPKQFRLSVEYGYSRMINDYADTIPQGYKDVNAQLRLASNFLLSVSAYLQSNIGIGLFYSRYISRASLNAFALSIGQKTFSGPYAEKLSVNYFGPVLGVKSSVWDKNLVFVADFRPGLVLFFDDISFADAINNFSSPVFGLGGSMGMEYLLKNNLGIGVSLNGLYASIRRLKDASGSSRRVERNISRVDLNLGIKFHLTRKHIDESRATRQVGVSLVMHSHKQKEFIGLEGCNKEFHTFSSYSAH
jgi:hypothetical protein